MRPASTKAGPAGWALPEGAGSVVLLDFPRANGSTHTSGVTQQPVFSTFFFDVIFFYFFCLFNVS